MDGIENDQLEECIVSGTVTYLDTLEECVAEVPQLLHRYAEDEQYQQTVDRICDLESTCDQLNRQLSALLANATVEQLGIRLTHVHLYCGQLIQLYQILDEIANSVEQFAEEFAAITPVRVSQCLDLLDEMADLAVQAMDSLEGVLTEYLQMLCNPYRTTTPTIVDGISQIRATESDCDRVRNEVIATAFDIESLDNPMVYRHLAVLLNTAIDTMEDATDQIIRITGNQSGIDIEPRGELQQ